MKGLLLVGFVALAWVIFSQVAEDDGQPEKPEDPAADAAAAEPGVAAAVQVPSGRILGTWAYTWTDAEAKRAEQGRSEVASGDPSAQTAAMLEDLNRRREDRLVVTETSLELTQAGVATRWQWKVLDEGGDSLSLTLTEGPASQGKATFEGNDWMTLILTGAEDSRELRWKRAGRSGAR
jgi:hypothetical protein